MIPSEAREEEKSQAAMDASYAISSAKSSLVIHSLNQSQMNPMSNIASENDNSKLENWIIEEANKTELQ